MKRQRVESYTPDLNSRILSDLHNLPIQSGKTPQGLTATCGVDWAYKTRRRSRICPKNYLRAISEELPLSRGSPIPEACSGTPQWKTSILCSAITREDPRGLPAWVVGPRIQPRLTPDSQLPNLGGISGWYGSLEFFLLKKENQPPPPPYSTYRME